MNPAKDPVGLLVSVQVTPTMLDGASAALPWHHINRFRRRKRFGSRGNWAFDPGKAVGF